MFSLSLSLFSLLFVAAFAMAFDPTRGDNVAVYWGQNSRGAAYPSDPSAWQKSLGDYCEDSTIDIIPLAFMNVYFGAGGMPEIDFSNACGSSSDASFPGTNLPNCASMGTDIKKCQAAGKILVLSLGGATGSNTLDSQSQAETFAETIWDNFLGGSGSMRPFGDAVLDGIDLDIEGGGTNNYDYFINKLRSLAEGATQKLYITGAPQCVFPDAQMGTLIDAVGFDAVFVQFYNNYCEISAPDQFNFGSWDNWAKTVSPNPNVKVYIGAPADATAAGSGYVDATTLGNLAIATREKYSSFGGIMLWDASQADGNNNYDAAVKAIIAQPGSGSSSGSASSTTTKSASSTSHTATSTKTSSSATSSSTGITSGGTSCAGVSEWNASTVYWGGNPAVLNGYVYTAKWWTKGETPGADLTGWGVWLKGAACTSANSKRSHFSRRFGHGLGSQH